MPNESNELTQTRNHLRIAERLSVSVDTPYHLEEAGDLLERISESNTGEKVIAENLGRTYGRIFRLSVEAKLSIKNIAEARLEQMLAIVRSLESLSAYSWTELGHTKVRIARRLIHSYYEGWGENEKQKEVRQIINSMRASRKKIAQFCGPT